MIEWISEFGLGFAFVTLMFWISIKGDRRRREELEVKARKEALRDIKFKPLYDTIGDRVKFLPKSAHHFYWAAYGEYKTLLEEDPEAFNKLYVPGA